MREAQMTEKRTEKWRARGAAIWVMVAASLCLMIFNTIRNEVIGRRTKKLSAEIPVGASLGGLPLVNVKGEASPVPAEGRYLLSILDTQCGPCKQQVESLNRATKEIGYAGVVAIFSESRERVEEFKSVIEPNVACLIDAGRDPVSARQVTTF